VLKTIAAQEDLPRLRCPRLDVHVLPDGRKMLMELVRYVLPDIADQRVAHAHKDIADQRVAHAHKDIQALDVSTHA